MVVAYLEKIREKLQEEKININTELSIVNMQLKENMEIIKFLEAGIDRSIEGFTPRQVDGFNYRKIEELKMEQKSIQEKIRELTLKSNTLEDELSEVMEVIGIARENEKRLSDVK